MKEKEEKTFNAFDTKASVLKRIKYGVIILLVLVLLFFLVGYREDITVENIRYLLKYVNVSPAKIGSADAQSVVFEEGVPSQSGVFRSDLVVVTKNQVSIYDMSAKKGFSDSVSLATPMLSLGDKYFAVYDQGDNYFALYNSFSKIYEETTPFAIWDIILGDNGDFCVITADKGYRSVLKIYNSDFENKMNWYITDRYMVCADIFSEKDTYYVSGCVENNENGNFVSQVSVLREDTETPSMTTSFNGEMILDTEFFENGNICTLTDTALRVLDLSGKTLATVDFNSDGLRFFEAGEKYSVLVLNENSIGTKHRVIIVDERGNTSMDVFVDSDIKDVSVEEENIILLGTQVLTAINADEKKINSHPTDKSYNQAYALTNSRAVVFCNNTAYVVGV